MPPLKLRFSTCPNDTFVFAPMVLGFIDTEGISFDVRLSDVEELNRMAFQGEADLIKVSYHAWLSLRHNYTLLKSGGAMGYGTGPLLIAREPLRQAQVLRGPIALPGEHTTAHLLFNLAYPGTLRKEFMVFSAIEEAVLSGKTTAGVIIHESRFTYQKKGLVKVTDLGQFWEEQTASPIPLGGIIARNSLGDDLLQRLNRIMTRSVAYALDHPDQVMAFVRSHAQEMDEKVMKQHIALYVNRFTLDPGREGERAIQTLIRLSNTISAVK